MKTKIKNKDAKKTFINKSAILIGNGVNRNSHAPKDIYNWEKLLIDLSDEFSGGFIKNSERKKPFPMFYDAIVNYAVGNSDRNETDIKNSIRIKLDKLEHLDKYKFIKTLECDEILTTNYDYLIEKYLDETWVKTTVTKFERFYSLSRFQDSTKRVWHIHGEQGDIRSMLLGFRLYINYTSKIKERVGIFISTVRNKLKKDKLEYPSWVDMFFTHNINIVGLGMDFTEYTIWWILAYRHFVSVSNPVIEINNKITYITPSFTYDENPHLMEMLTAYGVEIKKIPVTNKHDYDEFYKNLLTEKL